MTGCEACLKELPDEEILEVQVANQPVLLCKNCLEAIEKLYGRKYVQEGR